MVSRNSCGNMVTNTFTLRTFGHNFRHSVLFIPKKNHIMSTIYAVLNKKVTHPKINTKAYWSHQKL